MSNSEKKSTSREGSAGVQVRNMRGEGGEVGRAGEVGRTGEVGRRNKREKETGQTRHGTN